MSEASKSAGFPFVEGHPAFWRRKGMKEVARQYG